MARGFTFESLESRMFLSAATLPQDMAVLSAAVNTLNADTATAAQVISADKAKLAADIKGDSNLAPLRAAAQAGPGRPQHHAQATDRSNLKIRDCERQQTIIQTLRNDIRMDKAQKNSAQLKIDRAQLARDQAALQSDRGNLNAVLLHDIASTTAVVAHDEQAIANEIVTHRKVTLPGDRRTLAADKLLWKNMLASDRTAVAEAQAVVAMDG